MGRQDGRRLDGLRHATVLVLGRDRGAVDLPPVRGAERQGESDEHASLEGPHGEPLWGGQSGLEVVRQRLVTGAVGVREPGSRFLVEGAQGRQVDGGQSPDLDSPRFGRRDVATVGRQVGVVVEVEARAPGAGAHAPPGVEQRSGLGRVFAVHAGVRPWVGHGGEHRARDVPGDGLARIDVRELGRVGIGGVSRLAPHPQAGPRQFVLVQADDERVGPVRVDRRADDSYLGGVVGGVEEADVVDRGAARRRRVAAGATRGGPVLREGDVQDHGARLSASASTPPLRLPIAG